jgi:hypothetical protein
MATRGGLFYIDRRSRQPAFSRRIWLHMKLLRRLFWGLATTVCASVPGDRRVRQVLQRPQSGVGSIGQRNTLIF